MSPFVPWVPLDVDNRESAVAPLDGKLARFLSGPVGENYWSDHWKREGQLEDRIRRVERDDLGPYEALFGTPPRDGLVLEAGCGTGYVAEILRRRGYPVRAVDFDAETIADVRRIFPELDAREGNVEALDLADGSVACYISLGVVEHIPHGPLRALREVRRVLAENGSAFISVPHLTPARRTCLEQLQAGGSKAPPASCHFNYYYFSSEEITNLISEASLRLVRQIPLFNLGYLTKEHPIFGRFWRSPLSRQRVKSTVRRLLADPPDHVKMRYCHMMMYECRRA